VTESEHPGRRRRAALPDLASVALVFVLVTAGYAWAVRAEEADDAHVTPATMDGAQAG